MTISSSQFHRTRIGIIGLGNIGWALGKGMQQADHQAQTIGYDRNSAKRERFTHTTGIAASDNWQEVVEFADVILVGVRHNQVLPFLGQLCHTATPEKVLVCLAAALSATDLRNSVSPTSMHVVRAVTNVNVASRSGLTVVLRDPACEDGTSSAKVIDLFKAVGEVLVAESETDLDRWSVLSGCGPAAVAIFLQALCEFGITAGLDAAVVQDVAVQCVSATLNTVRLRDADVDLDTFKHSVAAPGGIVAKLLTAPESDQIQAAVVQWFECILGRIEGRMP